MYAVYELAIPGSLFTYKMFVWFKNEKFGNTAIHLWNCTIFV